LKSLFLVIQAIPFGDPSANPEREAHDMIIEEVYDARSKQEPAKRKRELPHEL
jgi:hypothetical protein